MAGNNNIPLVNVYCDESRYTNPFEQYFLIGGLVMPRHEKGTVEARLKKERRRFGFMPEMKWTNVTAAKLPYLNNLLQIFFTSPIDFRCIIIDKSKLKLSQGRLTKQEELSFYKFYYLMLRGLFQKNTGYYIFLDQKNNAEDRRISDLYRFSENALVKLNNGNHENDYLKQIQVVNSQESILIQLCDLLLGAVGYYWNGFRGSEAKLKFVQNLTARLQKPDLKFSSQLYDKKWNQFVWEPKQEQKQ